MTAHPILGRATRALSWLARCAAILLAVSSIRATSTADDRQPKLVPYLDTLESVETVIPTSHPDLHEEWNRIGTGDGYRFRADQWPALREGLLMTAAFQRAYYSDHAEVWFFLRDALPMAQAWKILDLIDPQHPSPKLKLLAVSRTSAGQPHLNDYLRDIGFTDQHFESLAREGRKALLCDSGFGMNLGKFLRGRMSPLAASTVEFQLNKSYTPLAPETTMLSLWSAGPLRSTVDLISLAPKSTYRVQTYAQQNGRWIPMASDRNDDVFTGGSLELPSVLSTTASQHMLEDMAFRARDPQLQRRMKAVEVTVRRLNALAKGGDRQALVLELTSLVKGQGIPELVESERKSLVIDWLNASRINPPGEAKIHAIEPAEVGIVHSAPKPLPPPSEAEKQAFFELLKVGTKPESMDKISEMLQRGNEVTMASYLAAMKDFKVDYKTMYDRYEGYIRFRNLPVFAPPQINLNCVRKLLEDPKEP